MLSVPEQLKILDFIESKLIEEPLAKTLSSRFGEGHTLYGGRKGFHDLMVHTFERSKLDVSDWLGHKDYSMTAKHYRDDSIVSWTPVSKKSA